MTQTPAAAKAAALLVATHTRDTGLLRSWLGDGDETLSDPSLRWTAVRRLVALHEDPAVIEREAARDRSDAGRLAAIAARAAIPTPEAKQAAWSLLVEGAPSNREWSAGASGFWSAGQHDLVGPFISSYLQEAPRIAERRGQAFARLVGFTGPVIPLPTGLLADLRNGVAEALSGHLHSVLRRQWDDLLDDLDRALRVRGS